MKPTFAAALLLAILVTTGVVLAAGPPILSRSVIAGGGGRISAGDMTLRATIGQPMSGRFVAGSSDLCVGFWCEAAACEEVVDVTISGPETGVVDTSYAFNAAVEPPTATTPIVYGWSPAPDSGQSTSSASYVWTTPGEKNVQVAVSNCGGAGTAHDTDTVTVEARLYLPLVVRESS
ncbi:MAG: hypothetical protein R6X31_10230 [Anaerolineae bacterium]